MAMAAGSCNVLLVEDTPPMARMYTEYLRDEPYDVTLVETGSDALEALERIVPEAMILDLQLPDMNGLEILTRIRERKLPTSVVVITSQGSINVAVEAMRAGAFDFLVKPFNKDRLVFTLRNAIEQQHLSKIVDTYREQIDRRQYFDMVGSSLAMQAVYRTIDSAAESKATVFITGESGTGKELCADAIHQRSPRGKKPFIAINCAAIPKDLMESEIFGHVKGAFTGATANRDGAATQADGGTFFLDEICEMDLELQSKLLRFVQTGSFQRVGGSKTEKVDVRFVCATNRDPWHEVEAGRFREDLYYRLHVIPLHVPPLTDRGDDVLEIATHMLSRISAEEGRKFTEFSPEAEERLRAYDWPGNVRQLENALRNVVVLNDGETVTVEMFPAPLGGGTPTTSQPVRRPVKSKARPVEQAAAVASTGEIVLRPMWQLEREMIEAALEATDGNVPRAAAILEISPATIYRKKSKWDTGE